MRKRVFLTVVFAVMVCSFSVQAQDVHLNELYISHSGADDYEYVELIGTPYESLDYMMVLVVEGDSYNAGTLDRAWDLTGHSIPSDGYFVLGDTGVANLDLDFGSDDSIENGTDTIYLVNAYNQLGVDAIIALKGTDLDPDDDGYTPIPGMSDVLDIIAVVDDDYPAPDEIFDDAVPIGPDGSYLPAGIFRNSDYPNDWHDKYWLDFDYAANEFIPRTPGEKNTTVQKDLGYGGPGDAELIIYGDELATGNTANLLLTNAPANETAYMAVGVNFNPIPLYKGTLVVFPWNLLAVLPIDANGEIVINGIPGGPSLLTVYIQIMHTDPGQPSGYSFSNALQVELLP